ncbi:hypothetical protein JZ751_025746, partial [Albula glossodonta]
MDSQVYQACLGTKGQRENPALADLDLLDLPAQRESQDILVSVEREGKRGCRGPQEPQALRESLDPKEASAPLDTQ